MLNYFVNDLVLLKLKFVKGKENCLKFIYLL